jgi:phospholipid/cholesterol/gamma-HCH transport system substrate-binding protein
MPRTRSLAWSELKLGIVSIAAIVLVVVLVVAIGGQGGFFWQRYPLKTRFTDIQGLKTGAVVRLSGKEVGTVTGIDFVGHEIEVVMEVSKSVRPLITTDSIASIGSLSLLGESIIDIKAASAGTPLGDWAYLPSTGTGGPFGDLAATAATNLQQTSALLQDIRSGKGTLGQIVTNDALYKELEAFITSATDVTRSINAGQGTIGSLAKDPAAYKSLRAALDNLQTMTARINSGQGALGRFLNDEAMGRSLSNTMSNVEQVTGRMGRGEGTIGKLLTDEQLYDRLNNLTTRFDSLLSTLEQPQGTVGKLLHDQQLYENMNSAVVELRNLVSDIRKDPKKYLRVSVSIF